MAAINSEDLDCLFRVLTITVKSVQSQTTREFPGPACTSVVRVFVESDKSFVRPTASESFQTCTSSSPVFGRDTHFSFTVTVASLISFIDCEHYSQINIKAMTKAEDAFAVDEMASTLGAIQNNFASTPQTKPTAPVAKDNAAPASAPKDGGYDRWTLKDESTLDYGHFGATKGKGIETVQEGDDTYYVTTAINYTNGPGHMGHAYEATTTDVIARYHRLSGDHKAVYFLTGTDEHGQKIAQTAADRGKEPIDICNYYSTGFRVLNQRLLISNDDYLRTTSDRHKRTAKSLWKKCSDAGDIYLDSYSGWYNVREETFVTDNDAKLWDYKDPTSGKPLKKVEEESYFFKMSKYHKQLVEHIENNPLFIQPEMHRNLILQRLRSDELRDLSISRTTFSWGIPVPEGFKENHVMYVWMDALTNYLTGINGLGVNEDGSVEGLSKFWPANNHVIGKDILWFHTVIWPCMLMSAGIPLAKTVYAHGFVNDKDGKKMSKSLGNVVDPHDMLDKFNVDTFRWYLCKEAPYGGELSFSEESMHDMHNADLCDNIGNCVNRAVSLCGRFCDGKVPDVPPPEKPPIDWKALSEEFKAKMIAHELQGGCQVAAKGFSDVNGWLQEQAPWAKKGDEFAEFRQSIVRGALEAIYVLSHLLLPYMPVSSKMIFQKLNLEPVTLDKLSADMRHLQVGTAVVVGEVLYEKHLSEEDKKAMAAKKKDDYAESKRKKDAAKAKNKANQAAAPGQDPNQPAFTKLDIRVGKITKVWNHPEADKLYCEEIDVGEESGPREIASGLRPFYSIDEMKDKKVLVVCNLKPQKMMGFKSAGMVLAAKSEDGTKVELIAPPEDAPIGERVAIDGLSGEPAAPNYVQKKKIFEAVAKNFKTIDGGVASWDGKPVGTTKGVCKAPSLVGAPIS